MFEISPDRPMPQLFLPPIESRDVLNVLKFRLLCRREGKTGAVMLPFGQAYHLDANGNHLDVKVPPVELELAQLLTELNETVVGCDPANNPVS